MPRRGLVLLLCVLTATAGQAAPRSWIIPLEQQLARISLGPTAGVSASLSTSGPAALLSIGLGLSVFDLEVETDPACEERRRQEREALGGERVKPWDDVLDLLQQPCRPLREHWWPLLEGGMEFALGLGGMKEAAVRVWGGGVRWKWFMLGLSASGVSLRGRDTLGLRAGPEMSAHFRLGGGGFRPVMVAFLRGEVTVIGRDAMPDQAALGARFLFDL